jgi:hypothetical protein
MNKETKIIKEYLKEIGAVNVNVRCGKYQTQADMGNNIIYFNPKDFQDKDFTKIVKDYYKSIGHKIKIHMGTYAILHELGHILSKMEIKNLDKRLDAYVKGQNNLPKRANDKVRFYKYRNLYIEKLADKYAYIIYKNFEKQSIKFDKELRKVAK